MRGYFGIGIYRSKSGLNIGTLWRSAHIYQASFIFTVGQRYKRQSSDTLKTPLHVPFHELDTFEDLLKLRPWNCELIGVELHPKAKPLPQFTHPERAIYLLGAEDNGIPEKVLEQCQRLVQIPHHSGKGLCLNVAVAGSVVMYDRHSKLS